MSGRLVVRSNFGAVTLVCTECKLDDKSGFELVVDAFTVRSHPAGVPLDVLVAAAADHELRSGHR